MSQESFAEAAKWDKKYVSNWLNHNDPKPDELRYYKLLNHIAVTGRIHPENYDRAFEGIANFLEFSIERLFDRRTDFVGHYAIYRYSMLAPGYILQGALNIQYDEKIKALRTEESFRIQSDVFTRIEHGEEVETILDKANVAHFNFPRSGYFFARNDDSYVMISKKPHLQPVQIQTIYFDNVHGDSHNPDHRELGLMYGHLTDWHSKQFYVTRVVALRRQVPLDNDEIRTLEPNKVNPTIREYLTRRLNVAHEYLVEF